MSRIRDKFLALERAGEQAFIAYIMAGDPDPSFTPVIARAIARHADIIELGIPFSDPVADGKTIEAASERALRAGMRPQNIFDIIVAIRTEMDVPIPIVVMSYYNTILQFGIERFIKKLAEVGGDGIIVPDLPVEEADELVRSAKESEIDTIFLVAPTTPEDRIAKICASSSGFVYLVSLLGVTGARGRISDSARTLIKDVDVVEKKQGISIPTAVGFGISKPEHVHEMVASGVNGVIVGSAIVELIAEHKDEPKEMISALEEFCRSLKEATRGSSSRKDAAAALPKRQ
ncbi:MAG: tryptophan synthase subunit alpha [Methanophagales archaeon]|nr:tryptophan synthase subunit alpha [Methanophagales archaeon]